MSALFMPAFLVPSPGPPILRHDAPRCGRRPPRRKQGPKPFSKRPQPPPLESPPPTGPQRHDLSVLPVDSAERALTEAVRRALRTRRDAAAYVGTAAELPAGVAGALLSRERAEDMLIVAATREAALRFAAITRMHLRGARLVVAASRGAGATTHAAMAANSDRQKDARHRRAVVVVTSVRALFHELSQSGHGRPWLRGVRFAVFADLTAMLSVGARTHLVAGLRALRPAAHRKSLLLVVCAHVNVHSLTSAAPLPMRHVVPASLLRRLVRTTCQHVYSPVTEKEAAPVIKAVTAVLEAAAARVAAQREAARNGNRENTEECNTEECEDWDDKGKEDQNAGPPPVKSGRARWPGDGAVHTPPQAPPPRLARILPSVLRCETLCVDTAAGVYATLLAFCRDAITTNRKLIAFFSTGRLVELYSSMARADGVAVHEVTRRSSTARRDAALDWVHSGAGGALFASDLAVNRNSEAGATYAVRSMVSHVVQVGLPARMAYEARIRLVQPGGRATLLAGSWEADGLEWALQAEGVHLLRANVPHAERAVQPWCGTGVDERMRSKAYCASVTFYLLERGRLCWKDKKGVVARVNEWATQLFGAVPGAERRIVKKMRVGERDGLVVRSTEVVPRNKHLSGKNNRRRRRQKASDE